MLEHRISVNRPGLTAHETAMSTHASNPLNGTGPEAPDSAVSGISTAEIHELLSRERRLFTIEYLRGRDGPIEFNDLVDYVACRENDCTLDELEKSERESVRVSLYQTHIDRLRDVGIVRARSTTGPIHPGPALETIEPYLDVGERSLLDRATDAVRSLV